MKFLITNWLSIVFVLATTFVPFTKGEKFNPAYLRPFAPYFSQAGQDKFLHENIFKGKQGGVFVDIGAHDGISYSNTYFFEKELGWTGICVEPQKKIFEDLKENRKCICLNGCVYTYDGEKEFVQVNGPSEMLSGLQETYNEKQLARAKFEVSTLGGNIELCKVKTFAFNTLCKTHKLEHIDLLSIDTEGSEEAILRSIDFDQVTINIIVAESNDLIEPTKNFLETKGYKLIARLGADGIYQRQSKTS